VVAQDPVLAHVISLELALLDPAIRRSPQEVERLLHPDFREVGVDGHVWDRDGVVAALASETGARARATDVHARFAGDDVVLVTYSAEGRAGPRAWRSRRSSIWVRGEDGWRVLFHQGTPADGASAAV
jgi:ribonuclease HI